MRIFAGTWLAYAGFYLCRKNFSVLMPMLSVEQGFSKDELANLIFLYSLAYACGQFIAGSLADRLGARPVVAAGMVLSAATAAAMAGSSALWMFAAFQLINGFAQSAGWPGVLKITAATFDPSRRGVLMAWWSTNYVVGGFLATILATWFATGPVAVRFGWRSGFLGPAILLTLTAFVFWSLVGGSENATKQERKSSAGAWKAVLSSPALRSIAACYFCLKLMRYSFLFWLPLYMTERLRYSPADAGYLSSAYELLGFVGVPLAGYLSDRVMHGRRFPVSAGMLLGLAIVCLLFPRLTALGPAATLSAIGIVGILTFGPDTLLGGAATQDASVSSTAATAGGFVNGVGSVGQLASPLLVAAVVRSNGWDGLFSLFVVVSLLAACVMAAGWGQEARRLEVKLANA